MLSEEEGQCANQQSHALHDVCVGHATKPPQEGQDQEDDASRSKCTVASYFVACEAEGEKRISQLREEVEDGQQKTDELQAEEKVCKETVLSYVCTFDFQGKGQGVPLNLDGKCRELSDEISEDGQLQADERQEAKGMGHDGRAGVDRVAIEDHLIDGYCRRGQGGLYVYVRGGTPHQRAAKQRRGGRGYEGG